MTAHKRTFEIYGVEDDHSVGDICAVLPGKENIAKKELETDTIYYFGSVQAVSKLDAIWTWLEMRDEKSRKYYYDLSNGVSGETVRNKYN